MYLIKLDATDSTNLCLRRLLRTKTLEDYTVVSADSQTEGRGQRDAVWYSEVSKNLTFSVLRKDIMWPVSQVFQLNQVVSLAILSVLKNHEISNLSIKWPNDILSGNLKLCGILIENNIMGRTVNYSIIGIGLNVNQTIFEDNLQGASSLKLVTGKTYDLDRMLEEIIQSLKSIFGKLESEGAKETLDSYKNYLFRKGMLSSFEDNQGIFKGCIEGTTPDGKLIITLEDREVKEYELKEVKFLL